MRHEWSLLGDIRTWLQARMATASEFWTVDEEGFTELGAMKQVYTASFCFFQR